MPVVVALLSVFLVLAGGWLAVMENLLRHPGYSERTAFALCIAAQGIAALAAISIARGRGLRIVLLFTACAMLAAGISTLNSALSAAHFEGFAVVIAAGIVLQSAALLAWALPLAIRRP